MRINYAPGYRIYYQQYDDVLVILLAGADKDSPNRDIQRAIALARSARNCSECVTFYLI